MNWLFLSLIVCNAIGRYTTQSVCVCVRVHFRKLYIIVDQFWRSACFRTSVDLLKWLSLLDWCGAADWRMLLRHPSDDSVNCRQSIFPSDHNWIHNYTLVGSRKRLMWRMLDFVINLFVLLPMYKIYRIIKTILIIHISSFDKVCFIRLILLRSRVNLFLLNIYLLHLSFVSFHLTSTKYINL